MSRIPRANREELSAEHQKIWDRINAVRSGGAGPYSMLLHVRYSPDTSRLRKITFAWIQRSLTPTARSSS